MSVELSVWEIQHKKCSAPHGLHSWELGKGCEIWCDICGQMYQDHRPATPKEICEEHTRITSFCMDAPATSEEIGKAIDVESVKFIQDKIFQMEFLRRSIDRHSGAWKALAQYDVNGGSDPADLAPESEGDDES